MRKIAKILLIVGLLSLNLNAGSTIHGIGFGSTKLEALSSLRNDLKVSDSSVICENTYYRISEIKCNKNVIWSCKANRYCETK